jgi:hypothetical protein
MLLSSRKMGSKKRTEKMLGPLVDLVSDLDKVPRILPEDGSRIQLSKLSSFIFLY